MSNQDRRAASFLVSKNIPKMKVRKKELYKIKNFHSYWFFIACGSNFFTNLNWLLVCGSLELWGVTSQKILILSWFQCVRSFAIIAFYGIGQDIGFLVFLSHHRFLQHSLRMLVFWFSFRFWINWFFWVIIAFYSIVSGCWFSGFLLGFGSIGFFESSSLFTA